MKKNIIILVLAFIIIIGGGYGYFGLYKPNQENKIVEQDENIQDIINKGDNELFHYRMDSLDRAQKKRRYESEHQEHLVKMKKLNAEEANLDKQLDEIKSDTFYKRHNN